MSNITMNIAAIILNRRAGFIKTLWCAAKHRGNIFPFFQCGRVQFGWMKRIISHR